MRQRLLPALLIVLLCPLAAAAADDATYSIRFRRQFTAEQVFSVSITHSQRSSQRTSRSASNATQTSSVRRVLLDADVHIDKVEEKQTKASVTIRRFELTTSAGDNGPRPTPATLLSPGTEVLLTYAGDDTSFSLKNQQGLSPDVLTALRQCFQTMALSDALYGTTEKKKVGDSWPLNTKTLVADRTDPVSLDPSQVSGTTTLKAARQVYGIPCLLLEGTQTTKDAPVVGITPKESTANTTFSLTVPEALDKPLVGYSIKILRHIVVAGQPSEDATLTADLEESHESTWVPK